MTAALLSWLGNRFAAPLATLAALGLAALLAWQSARIDGWPLIGGGLKAQIASLQSQLAAAALRESQAREAVLMARQHQTDSAAIQAGQALAAAERRRTQTQTLIEKVPLHVTRKSDDACLVPWGLVRLFDAAASGAAYDAVAAHVAPGKPDDAASDVTLSEIARLLATDFGIARGNADQLSHLEQAVAPEVGAATK